MDIILAIVLIDVPSPVKIAIWVVIIAALIWYIYSFAVKVLNTSKFEKLFFSKSQTIVHNTISFILEMLIFKLLIVSLSVMMYFSKSTFSQNTETILTVTFFITFGVKWLIIGLHSVRKLFYY
ncbi:hypothetical protein KHA80_03160 [Anaerobacillus sp. HL2]|nr:hypothetical protein KHA80_03160 [Anaerobacillus sp. HL2]